MSEPKPITNPFPGLRPFETNEYRLFFGREGQSDALIERLQRAHFLAVVGTSGSGKSSLIRAGMLPALRGGMMAGAGAGWRVAVMRPGHDPIGNLARVLAEEGVLAELGAGLPAAEAEAVVEATLRRGSLGLVDAARGARLAGHEKLLVVVDQFEELFRFRSARANTDTDDDASAFVKLLLEARQSGRPPDERMPIYVVLTMRSDFLGDCAQFQGLPEAINDGQYLIPRMTRDERRFAISGPVRVSRGKISEPLVNRLLNDVGDNPDQLPILQHALMRTWDYWQHHRHDGEAIGIEHYEAVGTMSDALSLHADEAWGELADERSRRIAELLFKALTERGADNREIRRPTSLREICGITGASEAEVIAVIEVFRREGRSFLMPPAGVELCPETIIDISHESLIRNWVRLKEWVRDEAEAARIYRRLAEAAMAYRTGEGGLLDDVTLRWVLKWREKYQPNRAWGVRYHPEFDDAIAYLEESRAASEKRIADTQERDRRALEQARAFAEQQARSARRLRSLIAVIAVMFLLALGTAGYAMVARQTAKAAEKEAKQYANGAKIAQDKAEKSEKEARVAQADAVKSAEENKATAARLVIAKEKTDKALVAQRAAVESQKKALEAQKTATALASEQRRKAEKNLASFKLAVDRSSANMLGGAAFQREDYTNAQSMFRSALSILSQEQARPDNDSKTRMNLTFAQIALLTNLGATQRRLGEADKREFIEAVKSYEDAANLMSKLDVSPNQRSAVINWTRFDVYHGLAHAYRDLAQHVSKDVDPQPDSNATPEDKEKKAKEHYEKAEKYFNDALAIQKEMLEKDDPSRPASNNYENLARLASGYENLARLYRDVGKYDKAEAAYKLILEKREKLPDKDAYLATLREFGKFYNDQKKYPEAAAQYEKAIAFMTDENNDYNQDNVPGAVGMVTDMFSDLGEVYAAQEDETKAKAALQIARSYQDFALIQKQNANADFKNLSATIEAMSDGFAGLGQYERAAQLYEVTRESTTDVMSMGRVALKEAVLYRDHLKNYTRAAESYDLVVKINDPDADEIGALHSPGSKDPIALAEGLTGLGGLYADPKELNDPRNAQEFLARSLKVSGTIPKERGLFETNKTLAELAKLHSWQGKNADSEQTRKLRAENAGKILSNALDHPFAQNAAELNYGEASREYLEAQGDLAAFYLAQHREDEAFALYKAMLGDPAKDELNPTTCCIRLDTLIDTPALALYATTLDAYHQLLLARRMTDEAAKVAAYIEKVKEQQTSAKMQRQLLGQ